MRHTTFDRVYERQPVSAAGYNRLQQTVQGLTRVYATGTMMATGTALAMGQARPLSFLTVRMKFSQYFLKRELLEHDEDFPPEDGIYRTEMTNLGNEDGIPAEVVVWDVEEQAWVDSGIEVLISSNSRIETPLRDGEMCLVYWDSTCGLYFPLTHYQVRHGITRKGSKLVSGHLVEHYPTADDNPNVYAVDWYDIKFKEAAGRQDAAYSIMGGESSFEPHAYVCNLHADDSCYLEEGTLVVCYYLDRQWWTSTPGTVGSGSGSIRWAFCKKRVVDVRCTPEGWEYDAEFDYYSEDGRLLFTSDTPCPGMTAPVMPAGPVQFTLTDIQDGECPDETPADCSAANQTFTLTKVSNTLWTATSPGQVCGQDVTISLSFNPTGGIWSLDVQPLADWINNSAGAGWNGEAMTMSINSTGSPVCSGYPSTINLLPG
jgi:hypothetical protein